MTTIYLTHVAKLWKFELMKMDVSVKQIGPGFVVLYLESMFGKQVILQSLTPIEPLTQKLRHIFYGPRHLAWLVKFSFLAESINVGKLV